MVRFAIGLALILCTAPVFAIESVAPTAPVVSTPDVIIAAPDADYQSILRYVNRLNMRLTDSQAHEISLAIVSHSRKNHVDPKLIAAVIAHESRFNPRAVGGSGARGLGQITPSCYGWLRISNPFDIGQNVSGTVRYMSGLLTAWEKYPDQIRLALASYNRGYFRIKRRNGTLDAHAKRYVSQVMAGYNRLLASQANFQAN